MIQDGNIMRYIPPVPYEEEVWFYEELDENVYLIKMIPGIKPRILRSVFENYDCIIVESFGWVVSHNRLQMISISYVRSSRIDLW